MLALLLVCGALAVLFATATGAPKSPRPFSTASVTIICVYQSEPHGHILSPKHPDPLKDCPGA